MIHMITNKLKGTIAMDATKGVVRGWRVLNTDSPITVPVGRATLGRIIDVIGEPIDQKGDLTTEHYFPINRKAPSFVKQATEQPILVIGIKVVDLLAPYQRKERLMTDEQTNICLMADDNIYKNQISFSSDFEISDYSDSEFSLHLQRIIN
ncbi:ATP synthase subunit beta, mitochondrial-like [Vigna radiata var. radiata]|uniref:H(+)-transporting two-sector ATPase n=1 Tax=Vigna radiata var. radiata TaxID=3916 RepID=A0A1S3T823_VIGRR|nr:ATP synthase subunit beta, mitochondrial-like [Vigna radiata var. radiata]